MSTVEEITPGWHLVAMVWDGDPIQVRGLDPWSSSWMATDRRIVIAHPDYPSQRHTLLVFRAAASSGRFVTFAAGELSNLAWAFFVPDRVLERDLEW